jgi:hypothetical protein
MVFLGSGVHGQFATAAPSCVRTLDEEERKPLAERYPNARVWFNHFDVCPSSDIMFTRSQLCYCMIRGKALICAPGIDCHIVLSVLVDDTKPLTPGNTTAILIKVWTSNIPCASEDSVRWVIRSMDPDDLGLQNPKNPTKEAYVRIAYMVSARNPAGCWMLKPSSDEEADDSEGDGMEGDDTEDERMGDDGTDDDDDDTEDDDAGESAEAYASPRRPRRFTSYDFWCAGRKPTTFNIIGEDQRDAFKQLLLVQNRRSHVRYTTLGVPSSRGPANFVGWAELRAIANGEVDTDSEGGSGNEENDQVDNEGEEDR